jgi:hypothetical protein
MGGRRRHQRQATPKIGTCIIEPYEVILHASVSSAVIHRCATGSADETSHANNLSSSSTSSSDMKRSVDSALEIARR